MSPTMREGELGVSEGEVAAPEGGVAGVADVLRELAGTRGAGIAVLDGAVSTSWAALDAAVDVAGEGVTPGAVVPIDASPSLATIARILGVLRAGAIAAPLAANHRPAERAAALEVLRRGAVPPGAALIVMTSGTTGAPKGVAHSEASLLASAVAWRAVLPPANGWVLAIGLSHVAGLGVLWRALLDGVPIRIVPGNDTARLAEALRDPRMSHASLVPTQLTRLLDLMGAASPPASLRAIPLGGGTIPEALVRRAVARGWPVVPTYGLSEMASGVTALPTEEAAAAAGSAGRPMPGVELSIADPDDEGIGEIVAAGPSAFLGYLGEPPRAAGAPFHTGDLGRLDDRGRLVVVDRRVDRIIRGGENIDPSEVEAVLAAHPAIADTGVVARRDETLGHVPVAAIVLRHDAPDPGDTALAAHCQARLAGFKAPAAFVRLDVLPRTTSGKLRRADLRALLDGAPEGRLQRPGGDAVGWRVTGEGARSVVLLHGTLSTSRQLDRLAMLLADACGAAVHALDRRGSGTGRLADPRPLDVAVHVADVVAYLDARAIGRADFVGVSFGGVVALETAARHPARVASVSAYEPPYGAVADTASGDAIPDVAGRIEAAYGRAGAAGAAETFMRAVAGDPAWDALPGRSRSFLEHEGVSAVADGSLLGLEPAGLGAIAAPVLLLTGGASDAFYAPIADDLARRIPGSRRVTLDGLAHPAPINRPTAVADAIRTFLESTAE